MKRRSTKSSARITTSLFLVTLALLCPAARAADANLLLITIDTLRPDRLSCYSPLYLKTATVDALAARGALFENAFAHDPITLPSHANILLGLTSLAHGVAENAKSKVADAFLTMAELLKAQGYATGAFVGAFPLNSRFGLNQGFDVYDDATSASALPLTAIYSERKAEQVVTPALAWLSKRAGKWFCWIHLWDPHAPYDPPQPYATLFANDLYSGEVAYVDAELGRVFDALRKNAWADKTLVVLTADHGESLSEHGELTHSYFAYNSTLHVPLIIAGPGVRPTRVKDAVSHIDIFPTVCGLLGIAPPNGLQGVSLTPLLEGKTVAARPIYIESLEPYFNKGCAPVRGYIEKGMKYLETPIPELYDLTKDAKESSNLASKSDLVPYKKRFEEIRTSLAAAPKAEAARVADRQTLDRLRTLGYVASPVTETKSQYGPEDDVKTFLPFQQKMDRAIELSDAGKTDECVKILTGLVAEKKNFTAAYTFLSSVYLTRGQSVEAIRLMDAAVKANPRHYSMFSAYGELLVKTGQYIRAREILQQALAMIDFDPETWDNMGLVSMKEGDYAKALEYFQKAVALDRTFAFAYSNLGATYFFLYSEQGHKPADLARSIYNFQTATALNPALSLAFRGLGIARRTAGDVDGAVAAWEKAVVTDPKDDISAINLGEAYLGKGDKSRARKCFERYLEIKGATLTPDERSHVQALIDKCR